MQALEKIVADSFAKIVESGAIEKAIEQKLGETIVNIVQNELRDYSDFSKTLKEHVKTSLQVNFDKLDLPSYNDLILRVIRQTVLSKSELLIQQNFVPQIEMLLAPAPSEIKISKLIANFIEYSKSDDCSCSGPDQISLIIETTDYNSKWVSFDKDPNKMPHQCAYRFGVSDSDGHMFALRIDDAEVKKYLYVGEFYNFERDLFQMYAAKTKVIFDADADDIDTSYPGHGDY